MQRKPDPEFAALLNAVLVTGGKDSLIQAVSTATGYALRTVYAWTKGEVAVPFDVPKRIARVLRENGRADDAALVMEAVAAGSGFHIYLAPTAADGDPRTLAKQAVRDSFEVYDATEEHHEHRASPAAVLQTLARICRAQRALAGVSHCLRPAVGA